jgi:hypothetical protein
MNDWIKDELGSVRLGDERLNQRVRLLLARKWQFPQRSFSAACRGRAEIDAASRFFNNAKAAPDKIFAAHRAAIVERLRQGGHTQVLLVQDTTECDYTTHKKLQGRGPLSSPERRGFFAHNLLVVTPEGVPLGLWYSFIYARDEPADDRADCKHLPIEQKESFRWLEGYREACALAGLVPECEVLCVADRESDIYELFVEYAQRQAQGLPVAQLLIRSQFDRCLEPFAPLGEPTAPPDEPTVPPDEAAAGQPAPDKILGRLAAAPLLGTVRFHVPEATQRNKKLKGSRQPPVQRSARTVEQEVKAISIQLKPPYRSAAAGGALPPVELFVVEARELHPPAGEEPLVWVLLTTRPVATFEQAGEMLEFYLCRWIIELLHRVLKSGCKVEEIQQRFDFRIKPVIVLYLLVAWRLLYVMRLGRECPELPCDLVFDESEWKPVVVVLKGRAELAHKPTLGEMVLMVGELGGYVRRKNDPHPGMKSMWIGYMRVADFARCWECFGPPATDTS